MTASDLSSTEIAQMLNAQALALARVLLPAGVEAGGYYNVGSVDGEAGSTLKIKISGAQSGRWADYAYDKSEERGAGDMLKLVRLTVAPPRPGDKQVYAAAVEWAKGWLGIESMDPRSLDRQRERAAKAQARAEAEQAGKVAKSRRNARGLWQSGAPLGGTPAQHYLHGRGIDFAVIGRLPGSIRFRHDVWHAELGRAVPAMLTAGILNREHVATHATYLHREPSGQWVKLPPVEVADPRTGEIKLVKAGKKVFGLDWHGAHFPVHRGSSAKALIDCAPGEPLAISEGMEDALTRAMVFPERRVVMAATLGGIGPLVVPGQCGDLTLLAQRDAPGSPADLSLQKQIARQQQRAIEDGSQRRVLCDWPGEGFKDINDELRGIAMSAPTLGE